MTLKFVAPRLEQKPYTVPTDLQRSDFDMKPAENSGLGAYITYLGANAHILLGLQQYPVLLLIGVVLVTAIINLLVGGLTLKWMLRQSLRVVFLTLQ